MAGFTKLFSQILDSTIWDEPWEVKGVWITLLAMSDSRGRIMASVPGLARRSTVTLEQCEAALALFLGPDKYSRTPDNDGRRIEAIDGGWRLLNYQKYREMRDDEARKEYQREWDRTRRVRQNMSDSDTSRQQTTKAEAEAEAEAEADKEKTTPAGAVASLPKGRGKRGQWKLNFDADVVEAMGKIMAIWPDSSKGQPKKGETVPASKGPEVAKRLQLAKANGMDLGICVAIAERFVEEFERGGMWAKAAENFFGLSEDAPWHSYYAGEVYNRTLGTTAQEVPDAS